MNRASASGRHPAIRAGPSEASARSSGPIEELQKRLSTDPDPRQRRRARPLPVLPHAHHRAGSPPRRGRRARSWRRDRPGSAGEAADHHDCGHDVQRDERDGAGASANQAGPTTESKHRRPGDCPETLCTRPAALERSHDDPGGERAECRGADHVGRPDRPPSRRRRSISHELDERPGGQRRGRCEDDGSDALTRSMCRPSPRVAEQGSMSMFRSSAALR